MKIGDIILFKCSSKRIIPLLIMGKKAQKVVGLQVQRYSKIDDIKDRLYEKYSSVDKKRLRAKEKNLDESIVYIGKPKGLRYEAAVKVNREFVIEAKNIIVAISKIDNKLYNKVLEKYKNSNKKQKLHRELHELKRKILLCQMNNEKYDNYENRLNEILRELDYPEINSKGNGTTYKGLVILKFMVEEDKVSNQVLWHKRF